MGVVFTLVSAYIGWHIQRVEVQLYALQQTQSSAEHTMGMLRQHLNDASALLERTLLLRHPPQTILAKEQLKGLHQAFDADLQDLQQLDTGPSLGLDTVTVQSDLFFEAGHQAIDANLLDPTDPSASRGTSNLTATTRQLYQSLSSLRQQTDAHFKQASQDLLTQLQHTRSTAIWSGWATILLIAAYAAWLGWRHLSRPLRQLAQSTQRIGQQGGITSIPAQERADEIGHLAQSLQQLNSNLQQQWSQHQRNHERLEQLQTLTSALPGAVFQLQVSGNHVLKLQFISPQWPQLMGLDSHADHSTAAAIQYFRDVAPQIIHTSEQHFLSSAQSQQPVNFDTAIQMPDGTPRWIKTRSNPAQEQADGSLLFNGIWQDVTHDVLQSQALSKAKSLAEQSIAERTAMQAAISHEIRTPLNAILGLTQLLLKADLPVSQREQLNHVLRAGQHLHGIVNEVLDFSKIDAGQLQLESTDFSLETVVLDVIGMCQKEANKKGLTLHYKIARQVPDSLRGDPHRIAQILLNYVNNAIKFTSTGHIDIALRLDPSSTPERIVLHASVKDTGPGIPEDRLALLFKAYQQADQSITRRFGGTGLGLAISRALAQLMGGSVGVQSIEGAGSIFWFTATLEPAHSIVQRTPYTLSPVHTEAVSWEGLRVLVVDDNPLNRAVAEGMLQALGLQTDVAEDGALALMKLQACGPRYFSCVFMDIQMPHMDGLSATKALRQLPGFENLPVIAMTAHTAVQDAERSLAAGMNAHLSKPLLESALHAVLQEWLVVASPADPESDTATAGSAPPVFDAGAVDALAQLFAASKLQQLVEQFASDTLQRSALLKELVQQQQWQEMRIEAHKLTGTAATFGLMQLGHYSSLLSTALKAEDLEQIPVLTKQVCAAAENGVQALQAYL